MVAEAVPESNGFGTGDTARAGDTLGYARASTNEQNPEAQRARLIEAGAIWVFTDVISGKRFERPGLAELTDHARPGVRLCVIRHPTARAITRNVSTGGLAGRPASCMPRCRPTHGLHGDSAEMMSIANDEKTDTVRVLADGLASMARELEPALKGLRELAACVEPLTRSLETIAAPLVQVLAPVWAKWHAADSLLKRGWVPNHTTPFDLVAECEDDVRLQTSLLAHYTDNWCEVRVRLETRLASYDIDDEAKATFREALDAHEAGFYRSVSRLLFPEFERVFRAALFDGRAGRISYHEFVKKLSGAAANLELTDFLIAGIQDMVLFKYLTEGVRAPGVSGVGSFDGTPEYVPGLAVGVDEANLERAKQSPIPTRHAVAHGLVTYSSRQSSLNAIFIADYVFAVVSRALRRPPNSDENGGQPLVSSNKRGVNHQ